MVRENRAVLAALDQAADLAAITRCEAVRQLLSYSFGQSNSRSTEQQTLPLDGQLPPVPMEDELLAQVRERAKQQGISVQEVVRQSIRRGCGVGPMAAPAHGSPRQQKKL